MFLEVEHIEHHEVTQIGAYVIDRERYLERLAVAALNALVAVDPDAFNDLVKRVKDWT